VRERAVEFHGSQISRIEHVAILVVFASAIFVLPLASRQAVSFLDVSVVSPLQDRVQASGIECQQFAELRPPAHPDSAF
jgi:hypothetical protein